MKYRKKPVVIEAVRFPLHTAEEKQLAFPEWPEWLRVAIDQEVITSEVSEEANCWCLRIRTLEGDHIVSPRDYIIQGVKGELYPCKPDIFEATYEPVV